MIRVVELVEYMGWHSKLHGKNVGTADINIDCPFCNEGRQHLGIHRTSGVLNCWVCGFDREERRPTLLDLIVKLEGVDYTKAREILKDFIDEDYEGEEDLYLRAKTVKLPDETESFFRPKSKRHRNIAMKYLKSRGFDEKTVRKYHLKFCCRGEYALRIIVPVYFQQQLVTFLGRDYYNRDDEERYHNCPLAGSIMRPKEILYGYDNFEGSHLRLVEGVTDKWRIGKTSLAVLRSILSRNQRSMILGLGLKSLSIFFDRDAYSKAYAIAEDLEPFIPALKLIDMGSKDAADRTMKEILYLESYKALLFS